MKHLTILFLILNLVTGTGIFIYLQNSRREIHPNLKKYLSCYIISYNLLILVALTYEYTLINLFNGDIFSLPPLLLLLLMVPLYASEFGMTYYIYRLTLNFRKKEFKRKSSYLFAFWLILFSAASLFSLVRLFKTHEPRAFYFIHQGWIMSHILIIFFALINLYRKSSAGLKRNRGGRDFALIFITGYLGYAISQFDFYYFHLGIEKYDYLILLSINFCPYLWIKLNEKNIVSAKHTNNDLSHLKAQYAISNRELEIIHLIVEGKSNKEIEEALFISFNTVKNHIYNIYQKLHVKSRSQLIHFIHQL